MEGEKYNIVNTATYPGVDVTAQPVMYPTVTTVNMEQAPQGQLVMQANNARPGARQLPPPGRWSDSICDWPTNLFPSCWCICCCCQGMWLNAQMSEKTGYMSFNNVIMGYILVWIIAILLQIFLGASFIVWIPAISASFFAIGLRMHITRVHNITECGNDTTTSQCGECCTGFWCWYCSVSQMARHIYGYNKVLDGDSDIDRPDNYNRV